MSAVTVPPARAVAFVEECRAVDPLTAVPHRGDLCWMLHNSAAVTDPAAWRFAGARGDMAMGIVDGDTLLIATHRNADRGDVEELRRWGWERIAATAEGDDAEIWEEVAGDDPAAILRLESDGYRRNQLYKLQHRRNTEDLLAPSLPAGYGFVTGTSPPLEVGSRAALHRASFLPYSSPDDEAATARFRRAMATPGYEPGLDLVVLAPDGTPAAGGLCWIDERNRVGLFEPIGVVPVHRRRGLATALMWEGLRRLHNRGATHALVGADHPGPGPARHPEPFTSSRFVFAAVGFEVLRSVYLYRRPIAVEGSKSG